MCTAAAAATTAFLSANVVGLVVHGRAQLAGIAGWARCCTNTRVRNAVPTFMEVVLDTTLSSKGKMYRNADFTLYTK